MIITNEGIIYGCIIRIWNALILVGNVLQMHVTLKNILFSIHFGIGLEHSFSPG